MLKIQAFGKKSTKNDANDLLMTPGDKSDIRFFCICLSYNSRDFNQRWLENCG
jgi:hypothetical protein